MIDVRNFENVYLHGHVQCHAYADWFLMNTHVSDRQNGEKRFFFFFPVEEETRKRGNLLIGRSPGKFRKMCLFVFTFGFCMLCYGYGCVWKMDMRHVIGNMRVNLTHATLKPNTFQTRSLALLVLLDSLK